MIYSYPHQKIRGYCYQSKNFLNVTLKKRTMRSSSLDKDDFRLRGCIIDRFWEIGKQLGRGAFGTVYESIGIDRQKAAIKIMPFFVASFC